MEFANAMRWVIARNLARPNRTVPAEKSAATENVERSAPKRTLASKDTSVKTALA